MVSKAQRDLQRWARKGSTAQRGYGVAHQSERDRRLAAWQPGDLCAHCGQPMWWKWALRPDGRRVSLLDLPHNDERTGYLAGLAHRACNRGDGARRGNRMRGQARQAKAQTIGKTSPVIHAALRTSRDW